MVQIGLKTFSKEMSKMPNRFEEALRGVASAAESAIATEESDYIGDDGLLVCGVCQTPKQVRIRFGDSEITPKCLCKCGQAQYAAEERDRAESKLYSDYDSFCGSAKNDFALLRWLNCHDISISPRLQRERSRIIDRLCFKGYERLRHCRFESDKGFNPAVSAQLKAYVEDFPKMKAEGKGICLYGEVGRGKSFLAACVGNALIDSGYPVLFTSFLDIEAQFMADPKERTAFIERLNEFPLIIVDDLGAERDTPYMQDIVYTVIDSRAKSGLPIFVTTNLTAPELKSPRTMKESRIYSRLYEMCFFIEVSGGDHRREVAREDAKKYTKIARGE